MPRVLVIGAGHNGLVAAIALAARGLEASVLEQGPRVVGGSGKLASALRPLVPDKLAERTTSA